MLNEIIKQMGENHLCTVLFCTGFRWTVYTWIIKSGTRSSINISISLTTFSSWLQLVGFYVSSVYVCVCVCPLIINPLADLRPGSCLHTDVFDLLHCFLLAVPELVPSDGNKIQTTLKRSFLRVFLQLLLITFARTPVSSAIKLIVSRMRWQ